MREFYRIIEGAELSCKEQLILFYSSPKLGMDHHSCYNEITERL